MTDDDDRIEGVVAGGVLLPVRRSPLDWLLDALGRPRRPRDVRLGFADGRELAVDALAYLGRNPHTGAHAWGAVWIPGEAGFPFEPPSSITAILPPGSELMLIGRPER